MTVAEFKAAFAEFANTPTDMVQARLDWAEIRTPSDIWGDHQEQGIGFLTAHYLALAPNAKDMRAGEDKGSTMYMLEREKLELVVSSGYRVAGIARRYR
jgi:hypothetical protein